MNRKNNWTHYKERISSFILLDHEAQFLTINKNVAATNIVFLKDSSRKINKKQSGNITLYQEMKLPNLFIKTITVTVSLIHFCTLL
jgi:hypothetical protein